MHMMAATSGIHSLITDNLAMCNLPFCAQGQSQSITSVAATQKFIVTSSREGVIAYYLADDCSPVNEYRHEEGAVVRIFPQPAGSRMVFEDDNSQLHVFNPVNDQVCGERF